jgi:transcriptional/translational regulatory protein YebC/TACO1
VNVDLARALREAHSHKLPRENIEKALNKGKDTASANFDVGAYEIFGFGGVALIAATLTDNTNRAFTMIRAAVNKAEGAKLASVGSVLFQFDHKVRDLFFCCSCIL